MKIKLWDLIELAIVGLMGGILLFIIIVMILRIK